MKGAIGLWVRSEVGRRWKALVALGLLAGLVGGLALAAVAGARRTSTAYDRFREVTGRVDAIVFASLIGVFDADYTPVRNLPEVEDAGEFALTPIGVEGQPELGQLAPNDDRLYRTIARPLLSAGRLPDPRRADEVVVNPQARSQLGLSVGDRLRIISTTSFEDGAPLGDGPSVEATVVGVGYSTMELIFDGDNPGFTPSGAFLADRPEIPRAGNLLVRLKPGTDVVEFGRRTAEVMGLPNLPVRDMAQDSKRITHGTDLERTSLLLFAVAVALAGMVLVGQALSRTVYAVAEPVSALRALGFTRDGLLAGLVLPLTISAAAGMATAVLTAVALSRWFPVGLAGRLEPDRGIHADWLVLTPGALLVGLAILAGGALSGLRATALHRRVPVPSPKSLVGAVRRVAPVPAGIGAGMALERGEGERALPVRPALAGTVAAVLGVVGAFGLLHGMDRALSRPELSGQFWDADILVGQISTEEILGVASSAQEVDEIAVVRVADLDVDGVSAPVYALEPVRGDRTFTLLAGRRPTRPDEVVIAPATAKALGRGIGDTVRVGGPEGTDFRVVGRGLLPQTAHFSFDQGAWMSTDGFDAVAPAIEDGARFETVIVRFAPGVDVEAGIGALQERLGPAAFIEPSSLPQDVALLRNVRTLPKALAVFLVLLGLGAMGHVLATAVRRRRHDLAVLRAIGFRPVQVGTCVVWQAVTVSVVALVIGIPLGIAVGRWSWRWVADSTPILYAPPMAAVAVLISIPAALLLANAMAALPARRAARLRPAEVLRAE